MPLYGHKHPGSTCVKCMHGSPYLNMIRPAGAGIRGENTTLCRVWM